MCIPRFDSPPVFGKLIDQHAGGIFSIEAKNGRATRQRYREGSTVVETDTVTATGRARLTDATVANVTGMLLPQNLLVRQLVCTGGSVQIEVVFDPRWGLPGRPPERVRRMRDVLVCEWGSLAISLECSDDIDLVPGGNIKIDLRAGESLTFVLSIADRSPIPFCRPDRAAELLQATDTWWRDWSQRLTYEGPHRPAVIRSLLTLRLLTYSPSGAPVAAPTTSLPEAIGSGRNWDYRYAWPRDASIGIAAFLSAGDDELAHSFMHWLLHASRLTRPRLSVLYDIYGKPGTDEEEIDVSGFLESRPVRVGNGAKGQHQLDVYGWVIDAAYLLENSGRRLHGETWRALAGYADLVAGRWKEPDAGIWEVRGDPAQYVHSKLMAWLALDRIVRLASRRRVRSSRTAKWVRERKALAAWVRSHGVDHDRNTLTWKAGEQGLDASLLLLAVLEFEPSNAPLMLRTIEMIRRELEIAPGLLLRYERRADELEGSEGAFLPCSFWLVQALARVGRVGEADELFDRLLSYANDVGLFSEQLEPSTGELIGNFPQAFTHATLVQAALALERSARVTDKAS